MKKTVVELHLKGYSDVARALKEQFSAEIVLRFNEQIQGLIDAGLAEVGAHRDQVVMASTGDGAILAFNRAEDAARFAEAVHDACRVHNHGKAEPSARRWFRVGIATGDLVVEEAGGVRKMGGSVIARAVRLEAAANVGEIVVDRATYEELLKQLQARYGPEKQVAGKRDEKFPARRSVVVSGLGADRDMKGKGSHPVAAENFGAFEVWREKLAYLEQERAITASPALKFELKVFR